MPGSMPHGSTEGVTCWRGRAKEKFLFKIIDLEGVLDFDFYWLT